MPSRRGTTHRRGYQIATHRSRVGSRRSGRALRLGPLSSGVTSLLLGLGVVVAFAGAATIAAVAADLPGADQLATAPLPLTTRIYDRSGEHLLYTLEDARRDLVPLAAVPLQLQQATVAIEDRSFWTNPGIDVGGILRAVGANA